MLKNFINYTTTLDNVYTLSQQYPCTIIELTNNKTAYCFGRTFLGTYKKVTIVDLNNIDNFRFIIYYPKLKIKTRQIIYKYKSKYGEYTCRR